MRMLGTSWWRGLKTGELFPNVTLGSFEEGHGGAKSTTPAASSRHPAQLFWEQRALRPISRPCRPVSRCGPKKISLCWGLGLSLPDRGADPSSPPHPDASNLIWHWHCHLGTDCLDATTTTPTFLCNAHAMAGVNVAHPPSRGRPVPRIRRDQSPCPALLPADHAPKGISLRALPSGALDKGAPGFDKWSE